MGDGGSDVDVTVDNLYLALELLGVLGSLVGCLGDPERYHWYRSSSCRNDFKKINLFHVTLYLL